MARMREVLTSVAKNRILNFIPFPQHLKLVNVRWCLLMKFWKVRVLRMEGLTIGEDKLKIYHKQT